MAINTFNERLNVMGWPDNAGMLQPSAEVDVLDRFTLVGLPYNGEFQATGPIVCLRVNDGVLLTAIVDGQLQCLRVDDGVLLKAAVSGGSNCPPCQ